MVAYSFKSCFVLPIQVGLGLPVDEDVAPKRQTIRRRRSGRSRHAYPGEPLQLYCALRTRQCFLIGRARCLRVTQVCLDLKRERVFLDDTEIGGAFLTAFAREDGFASWMDMRDFWHAEHPGVGRFDGVIIFWEAM